MAGVGTVHWDEDGAALQNTISILGRKPLGRPALPLGTQDVDGSEEGKKQRPLTLLERLKVNQKLESEFFVKKRSAEQAERARIVCASECASNKQIFAFLIFRHWLKLVLRFCNIYAIFCVSSSS
eukprot:COSAG05_NODE_13460_length_429_cov_0.933333_1_plen_124_part_01